MEAFFLFASLAGFAAAYVATSKPAKAFADTANTDAFFAERAAAKAASGDYT